MPPNDVMGGIAPCRWEPDNPTLFLWDLLKKTLLLPPLSCWSPSCCADTKGPPLSGPVHLLFSTNLSHLLGARTPLSSPQLEGKASCAEVSGRSWRLSRRHDAAGNKIHSFVPRTGWKASVTLSCHVGLPVGRRPVLQSATHLFQPHYGVSLSGGGDGGVWGFDEHVLLFPLDSQRLNSAKSFRVTRAQTRRPNSLTKELKFNLELEKISGRATAYVVKSRILIV